MSQLIEAIFYTTLAVMSLSHCCHGDCSYSIKEGMIVDFRPGTTPSTSPTPSTLNEISKSDLEECSELCCNNDNCTAAVFEEKKSTCHLIQCESENCPIVENSGFTTVEVTRNSTAEDESDDEGEEEGTVGSESDQGEEEGMVGSESEQDDEQGDKENESDNGEEGSETTKQTTVTQPTPTQTTGDTDENADKGRIQSSKVHGSVTMTTAKGNNTLQTVIGDGSTISTTKSPLVDEEIQRVSGGGGGGGGGTDTTTTTTTTTTVSYKTNNTTQIIVGDNTTTVLTSTQLTTENKQKQSTTSTEVKTESVTSEIPTNNSTNTTTPNITSQVTLLPTFSQSQTNSQDSSSSTTTTVMPTISVSTNRQTSTSTTTRSTESESTPANDEGQTSTPEDNSPQTDLQSTTVSTQMKTESSIEGKSTVGSVPNDGTETEMSPGTTEMSAVTNGGHNETQVGHRIYDHTSTGALVAAMCFGILFLFAVLVLLGKRVYEGYQRRHYSKMDYLINGMYN